MAFTRENFWVPAIVGSAVLMQTMDAAIVSMALPAIAVSLETDAVQLNLALTVYLVGAALFLPVSGWAAGRFGAKPVFLTAIVVFAVTSALCGAAQNIWQLVAARLLQGAASAMILPVGRLLLLRSVPKDQLISAMSVLAIPALVGPLAGAPLSGLIVTIASWRWVFLINIPVALVGLFLVSRFVTDVRDEHSTPLDVFGLVLSAVALAGLAFGFSNIGGKSVHTLTSIGLIAVGLLFAFAYWIYARRRTHAALNLGLLRQPTFGLATLGGFFSRMSLGATPFLLALLLQAGFGLSPLTAGLIAFAPAAGALLMRVAATPIIRRTGFRKLMIANSVASALAFALCAGFRPDTPHVAMMSALLVYGLLRSLQMICLNTLAFADLRNEEMGDGTTLTGVVQQLAQSLGVGVAASVVEIARHINGDGALAAEDIYPAFLVIALLSAFSTPFFWRLTPTSGAAVLRAPTLKADSTN